MQVETTTTIQDLIDIGKSVEMTYYKSSYIEKIGNIEYSVYNVIYDYMEEIEPYLQYITLSDVEYRRYKYKPRLLAYDLYGSTDLYFIIMIFNNICDIKDFTMRKIKLLSRSNLSIINKIFITEKEYLDRNRYLVNNDEQNAQIEKSIKTPEVELYDIYVFTILRNEYILENSNGILDIDKITTKFFNDSNKIQLSAFYELDLSEYLHLNLNDEERNGLFIFCSIPSILTEYDVMYYEGSFDSDGINYAILLNDEHVMFKLYEMSLELN